MPGATSAAGRLETIDALFAAAHAGDPRAREELVHRFLPLARSLALRFRGRNEPVEDLIQVASIGLVTAIERFDARRGLAFSSYAVPTILGELRRHFRDRTWAVHMPRRLQESSAAVAKASTALAGVLGRQPTVAELCEATELHEEEVLDALQAADAYRSTSLDRPIASDEDDTLGSILGVDDDGFDDVEARMIVEAAAEGRLTRRQRRVLWLHVHRELTQGEIAVLVGISQMQVSRDLRAAREALRSALAPPAPS